MKTKKPRPDNPESDQRRYMRNYNLAFQLVATIVILAFAGHYLDAHMENERPWFTLGGGVMGIVIGLMKFIRSASGK
ncbi:MAG: AtpZ/AtpI family protein [Flavobacteriales bacterium]|nr:AtpZ/AtpI family protein [Bacteroidota bacterium]MCB9240257.1 AtpZ/AtpI family protein [Flavobacteriales bacterium]